MEPKIIFLSASIPESDDPFVKEHPVNAENCKLAIRALIRNISLRDDTYLVCAYHPVITPIVVDAYKEADTCFARHSFFSQVQLFQGKSYNSLRSLRERMLTTHVRFDAGVFIGGKEGVLEEFDMYRCLNHSRAKILPIATTGGAAKLIYDCHPYTLGADKYRPLATSTEFSDLFANLL